MPTLSTFELDLEMSSADVVITEAQVVRMVEAEAIDLSGEILPHQLIAFWGGRVSHPALAVQAEFLGRDIYDLMDPEVSSSLGVSGLTIQSLERLRYGFGAIQDNTMTRYYMTQARVSGKGGNILHTAGVDAVVARLGKKATSRALALYHQDLPR